MAKFFCSAALAILTLTWITPAHPWTTRGTASPTDKSRDMTDTDETETDGDSDDEDGDEGRENVERYVWPEPEGTEDCTLRAYNADKDIDTIRTWHDLVKTPIDEGTAMRQLLLESCEDEKNQVMCQTFVRAREADKCIPGLTRAECLAVTMYTAEFGGFYREFNNASSYGVWDPYRVYTSLLYSAVKKLADIEPVPFDAGLYRGMWLKCKPPNATRIFWKTFTSTSLDQRIAEYFGSATTIVFQGRASVYGARIRNLSLIEVEDEVLIPPFELFDYLKADDQTFYFSSSKSQDLIYESGASLFQSSAFALIITMIFSVEFVARAFLQETIIF